ncbi:MULTISPECIES: DDE-type integrase/transposase/recombinase [unclassified Streptomyces]|uniref:DDE-type integrase/transposase/recombinase n=1 Tax=unclassified Streptomyces TaxID=2593676 RepID=UPI003823365E
MRDLGLEGARRGRKIRATIRDDGHGRWVADFTQVATWSGIVYVAFVVDVFSRAIVGWSTVTSKRAKLVLDLPVGAGPRRDSRCSGPVHHLNAGSQYTSFAFTAHLLEVGIEVSIGTVGDALENTLMESRIGLVGVRRHVEAARLTSGAAPRRRTA